MGISVSHVLETDLSLIVQEPGVRLYSIPKELFSHQLPSEFELAFSITMEESHIGLKVLKAQASDFLGPRVHTKPV